MLIFEYLPGFRVLIEPYRGFMSKEKLILIQKQGGKGNAHLSRRRRKRSAD